MIKAAIYAVAEAEQPVTVRRVFYALVTRGLVGKTEPEYRTTVCRLAGVMRERGEVPFEWFTDSRRRVLHQESFSSVTAALTDTARFYRRALWQSMPVYVECWIEKDALADAVYEVTSKWDVPLCVAVGYSGKGFAWRAAQKMRQVGKPAFVYQLGDHDPSGVDAARDLEAKLRRYLHDAVPLTFTRLCLTPEQVRDWDLPTRPTKQSDTRARHFEGESVELDAVPLPQLREIVSEAIEQHVDKRALFVTQTAEESERSLLAHMEEILLDTLSINDIDGKAREGISLDFSELTDVEGGA